MEDGCFRAPAVCGNLDRVCYVERKVSVKASLSAELSREKLGWYGLVWKMIRAINTYILKSKLPPYFSPALHFSPSLFKNLSNVFDYVHSLPCQRPYPRRLPRTSTATTNEHQDSGMINIIYCQNHGEICLLSTTFFLHHTYSFSVYLTTTISNQGHWFEILGLCGLSFRCCRYFGAGESDWHNHFSSLFLRSWALQAFCKVCFLIY